MNSGNNKKIAVIGNNECVTAFKAAGAFAFGAENRAEALAALEKLVADDSYGVIFITEDVAGTVHDILEEYKPRPYPIIIPIPSAGEASGYALAGIKKDVEKAIGADILFKD